LESRINTAKPKPAVENGQSTSRTKPMMTALAYCENGNLPLLKELLAAKSPVESLPSAHDMLVRACKAKHPQIVQFIIDELPDIETTQQLHSAAFAGGVEVYGIILNRYPELRIHSFGHTSDPISEAVLNQDTSMLDFLLENGFEAKNSHFCYIPVQKSRNVL